MPLDQPLRPRLGPFARWPRSSDAVLAALVFVIEVGTVIGQAAEASGEFDIRMARDVPPATYLLFALGSIALLWRRNRPLIVVAASLALAIAWDVIGLADGPLLAILVSLYSVGRYVDESRTTYSAAAVALLLVVIDGLLESEPAPVIALSLALVFVPWYVGRRIRNRGTYLALLVERAEYLDRERKADAQRAVVEERTRIARELHDLVAHRVSMITVQAGAAQTVAATDPERALRAMEAVEEAGREALDELRQVLGVLRADEQREGLVPTHGLADIPDLVAEVRRAGMDVSLSLDGTPEKLPARVDLASYRIVQEALTNVLKHAGPDPNAEVRLSAGDRTLSIEVTDRGVGVSALPGSGHGVVGMRERAVLLGGTFEAGSRPGGGYRVIARLPLEWSPQ